MLRSKLQHLNTVAEKYSYDNASCYFNAHGRPSGLPEPYGSNDVAADALYLLHPYWNPRCRYLSLPQAVSLADRNTGWLGDVLLPEAFTVEHEALQIDRSARLATCFIGHINDRFPTPVKKLIAHQKTLKSVTKVRAEDRDFGMIADVIADFLEYISPKNPTSVREVWISSRCHAYARTSWRRWIDGTTDPWTSR
jgi:hypothetical protein